MGKITCNHSISGRPAPTPRISDMAMCVCAFTKPGKQMPPLASITSSAVRSSAASGCVVRL